MNFADIFTRKSQFGFMPRFAGLVATGRKTTTIRKPRKREPECGDICRFWTWSNRPYNSPQWLVGYGIAVSIETIMLTMDKGKMRILLGKSRMVRGWGDDEFCDEPERVESVVIRDTSEPMLDIGTEGDSWPDRFAAEDGFSDASDMQRWFSENHDFPFIGTKTKWLLLTTVDWPLKGKPEVLALPRFAPLLKSLRLAGVGKRP